MEKVKYVVCYSGGHSSALVSLEAVKRHGKGNVIKVSTYSSHVTFWRLKGVNYED